MAVPPSWSFGWWNTYLEPYVVIPEESTLGFSGVEGPLLGFNSSSWAFQHWLFSEVKALSFSVLAYVERQGGASVPCNARWGLGDGGGCGSGARIVFDGRFYGVMSSASSAVTYTSVNTDSKPGRVFWGTDEEIPDGGVPQVIVYGYDGLPMQPVDPPSPDYVSGPVH
ncbi:hypothetical protein Tco_0969683 [Tanacetum coccineum]